MCKILECTWKALVWFKALHACGKPATWVACSLVVEASPASTPLLSLNFTRCPEDRLSNVKSRTWRPSQEIAEANIKATIQTQNSPSPFSQPSWNFPLTEHLQISCLFNPPCWCFQHRFKENHLLTEKCWKPAPRLFYIVSSFCILSNWLSKTTPCHIFLAQEVS